MQPKQLPLRYRSIKTHLLIKLESHVLSFLKGAIANMKDGRAIFRMHKEVSHSCRGSMSFGLSRTIGRSSKAFETSIASTPKHW